jgi:hypothetical protein
VVDIGRDGTVNLAGRERQRLEDLLQIGQRHYSALGMAIGDVAARRWLARTKNPYLQELQDIATLMGRPGVYALNMSYEWGCTTGVGPAQDGGMTLVRTLDWPLPGLGRHLVVTRQGGEAGPWLNLTWPRFVGVLTALAPGQFAAAINQPPMARRGRNFVLDWAANRFDVWRSRGIPPVHLLRKVFETCKSYDEARHALSNVQLCLPAYFTLAGAKPGEGCVIERQPTEAFVHEAPAAAANHWLTPGQGEGERGGDSRERQARMLALVRSGRPAMDWLKPPILNGFTRLAMTAEVATGALWVQGWEVDGPATAPLRLPGNSP